MKKTSEMNVIYEALKLLRRARLGGEIGFLSNGALYQLAQQRPEVEEDIPDKFGLRELSSPAKADVVNVVRLFSNSDDESVVSGARRKIEDIEVRMYGMLVAHLKEKFGEAWWFRGVPEPIRIRAAQLFEESEGEISKESALYLRDLKEMALAEWASVKELLGCPQESRRGFAGKMDTLIEIRNRLSHPLRLRESPIDAEELEVLEVWTEMLGGRTGSNSK